MELHEKERIDELQYKDLKIIQNTEEFCFGIDSILLSDFAKNIKKGSKVLDLGTGTGIIGVLLCGKTELKKIIGIDIQEQMCEMAKRSIKLNNLEDKFDIMNIDIKEADKKLEKSSFDVIVTNPPYKKENSGIKNDKESIYISRHETKCNFDDIARISYSLLKDKGEFYLVHRPERLVDICFSLRKYGLEPKVLRTVQSRKEEEPKLILIKAVKNGKPFLQVEKPLIIYEKDETYTKEILEKYGMKVEE